MANYSEYDYQDLIDLMVKHTIEYTKMYLLGQRGDQMDELRAIILEIQQELQSRKTDKNRDLTKD